MAIYERQLRERERRRQQIIAASKRVFILKGIKATIKDIAEEAELSPGTLYIYFKNKDELYASLSIRLLKHLNLRLQRVREKKELLLEQRIRAIQEALCESYEIDPPVFITLSHLQASETLDNISSDLFEQIMGLLRQSLGSLADIFADEMDADGILDRDPQQFALILWALFSGLVLWEESKRSLDPRKDFLKPTLELAFEVFGRGLVQRNAASAASSPGVNAYNHQEH
ncbi:MAG TPA: TetR/AcrR family transcriptional regulator [Desulfobacterales bacterium]|nr:TetR/AcrR family transcriptional regulator [Desulfobacterales bacterium]